MARAWKPWTKRTAWIVGIIGGLLAVLFAGVFYVWMELYYPGRIFGERWPYIDYHLINKSSEPIILKSVRINGQEHIFFWIIYNSKDLPKWDSGLSRNASAGGSILDDRSMDAHIRIEYFASGKIFIEQFVLPKSRYSCFLDFGLTDDGITTKGCHTFTPMD